MRSSAWRRLAAFACLSCVSALWLATSLAGEPLRLAVIEPLSGPFSNVAITGLKQLQTEVDVVNANGGAGGQPLELLAFDNKSSPQEAVIQLQAALDQGIRFVIQASGSNVAHALNDAIAKHNNRNPQRPVLFLNTGSLDPALTDDKCQFWMFRFVAHGQMMQTAIGEALARDRSLKRVYLINQDYAWGHSVARNAKDWLRTRRPDVEVVGEDLHPIGKIKDFSPYAAKIDAVKADAVITGNWGNDLSMLVKASKDAGSHASFYALLAGLTGSPTAIGASGADRVRAVHFWHVNIGEGSYQQRALVFRSKYKDDCCWLPNHFVPFMLAEAVKRAQSNDPKKVALALEDMRYTGPTGEVWMRPDDHQLMMPVYQTVFARVGTSRVKYDAEETGYGWGTEAKIEAQDNISPVTCRVQRP